MDAMIKKNTGNNLECSNCSDDIKLGDEYALLEDGTFMCIRCFDSAYNSI